MTNHYEADLSLGEHIEEVVARVTAILKQQGTTHAYALVNRPGNGARCLQRMRARHTPRR